MQEASSTHWCTSPGEGLGSEQLYFVILRHRFPAFPLYLHVEWFRAQTSLRGNYHVSLGGLQPYLAEAKHSTSASKPAVFTEQFGIIKLIWSSEGCSSYLFAFSPVQGVWLGQWGTGRKGAEEDEGLLWALPKVWPLVSRINLDITLRLNWLACCVYFFYSVCSLSSTLIQGGFKFFTELIFRGSTSSKTEMSTLVFRKRAMRRVPKGQHHEADWENTTGSDNTDTEGS